MPTSSIEERLTAIEQELAQIRTLLAKEETASPLPWWEKIAGTFAGSQEYEEAMRLGREYRESLRPKDDEDPA